MIHENIRRLREESNLTLEEVGKRIGTTKQTIKRYESGEISNIPYDKVVLLAKCLGVHPSSLMGWETGGLDAEYSELDEKIKQYALKISRMSEKDKNYIFQTIDMVTNIMNKE